MIEPSNTEINKWLNKIQNKRVVIVLFPEISYTKLYNFHVSYTITHIV